MALPLTSFQYHMQMSAQCYLRSIIRRANGEISKAAKLAGVNRTHFYKMLKKYKISTPKRRVNLGNAEWRALGG